MSKIMVVAVHPDDETLGAGGTLLKHKAQKDELVWVIVTGMPKKDYSSAQIKKREEEIKAVSREYGFDEVIRMDLPTTRLDEYVSRELVSLFAAVIQQVKPQTVYLPFAGDAHSDHQAVFNAAHACLKTFRAPFVKKVYVMETISETEFGQKPGGELFAPNYFVDVSKYLEQKIEIMKFYQSELAAHPFPRSVENMRALATFRGATSGCRYAESFMLVKEIA